MLVNNMTNCSFKRTPLLCSVWISKDCLWLAEHRRHNVHRERRYNFCVISLDSWSFVIAISTNEWCGTEPIKKIFCQASNCLTPNTSNCLFHWCFFIRT